MNEVTTVDRETPEYKFRNSVGFQMCFFQYLGASESDTIDRICNAATRLVDAKTAEAFEVLKLCRSALKSLPTDALGQDSEEGHYYRDELLAHVERVLPESQEVESQ